MTEGERLIHDRIKLVSNKIQLVNDRVKAVQEAQEEILRRLCDLRELIGGVK